MGNKDNSPAKRVKKKGAGSLDKESKDTVKQHEQKIEELRKQFFNEINRLEAMMEKETTDQKN